GVHTVKTLFPTLTTAAELFKEDRKRPAEKTQFPHVVLTAAEADKAMLALMQILNTRGERALICRFHIQLERRGRGTLFDGDEFNERQRGRHLSRPQGLSITAMASSRTNASIVYAAVDCTRGENNELCKQEGVEGYPTFNHYNYGKFVEKYNGDRGEAGFIHFMRSLRGRDQAKRKEEL
ncbi:hypothetical protein KUCAC02_022033, partial [Chaenocephalus aceratus]